MGRNTVSMYLFPVAVTDMDQFGVDFEVFQVQFISHIICFQVLQKLGQKPLLHSEDHVIGVH
jgi:hypothetical protein